MDRLRESKVEKEKRRRAEGTENKEKGEGWERVL